MLILIDGPVKVPQLFFFIFRFWTQGPWNCLAHWGRILMVEGTSGGYSLGDGYKDSNTGSLSFWSLTFKLASMSMDNAYMVTLADSWGCFLASLTPPNKMYSCVHNCRRTREAGMQWISAQPLVESCGVESWAAPPPKPLNPPPHPSHLRLILLTALQKDGPEWSTPSRFAQSQIFDQQLST